MSSNRCSLLPSIIASILLASTAVAADEPSASARLTTFDASFFSNAQPYSAFDMLALLPGFTFTEADSDLRGLSGSAGNVLIDGDRPASKHESLETILRRIPASAVTRVELLRAGARGLDMQGHTVLANIVRIDRAQTRGSVELGSEFYDRGLADETFDAPRIAGEFSRRSDGRLIDIAAALYRAVDDERGDGDLARAPLGGAAVHATNYAEDEGARVAELSVNYERKFADGKLRVNGSLSEEKTRTDSLETFLGESFEAARELEQERQGELGVHYEQPVGERSQLELIGIHRRGREDERDWETSVADDALFRQTSSTSESILRGVLRRAVDAWIVESGAEGALNVLDSDSALTKNDVRTELPAASVRVEERRGEAFATATWRMSAHWTFEFGSRVEASQLVQSGDSNARRSFLFAKPRVLAAFAPTSTSQWRVLIEHRVGQLDFDDFVTSTSLSEDTVTAGNPNLEPDRKWVAELTWEQRFSERASVVLTARHEKVSALLDRVPVDTASGPIDGVGNIGDGERNELDVNISVPLQALGMTTGLLKASALWRASRAVDPTTGETRTISEDVPFEAALHFTQDLPQWRARWGVDVELEREFQEFMIDEIRTETFETMVNVFAEYEPAYAWKLRVFVNNLTDRAAVRERRIYDGLRGSAPLSHIETRTLEIGPYAGLSVRRSFGL